MDLESIGEEARRASGLSMAPGSGPAPMAVDRRRDQDDERVRSSFARLQLDLVVARCHTRVPADWGRPERCDPYYRLYLILGGEGRIAVDGVELRPTAGQLCLLPAAVPLSYSTEGGATLHKHWLHFVATIGEHGMSELVDLPYCVTSRRVEVADRLFRDLAAASGHPTGMTGSLRIRALLYELFAHYVDSAPAGSVRPSRSTPASRSAEILRYIDDHLAESLTVEALAEVFHYNPNYFIRYFRSRFGASPNQYIRWARVERAKGPLVRTDRPIEVIAGEVGLEQSYFSKVFRQLTSLSPTEYRRLHRTPW